MKYLKTHNNFLNESLKDKLKGKSEEEIKKNLYDATLSPGQLLKKSAKHGFMDGVKSALKIMFGSDIMKSILINWNERHLDDALLNAITNGHIDIVKVLLDNSANPNSQHYDMLYFAVGTNNYDIVKLLLDSGVSPDSNDYLPFESAILSNNYDIVKLFLEYGANPKFSNNYPARILRNDTFNDDRLRKLIQSYIDKKNVNESLKNKLKGKSEEEVLTAIEKLSLLEQFEKACENGILSIVKKLLKNDNFNPLVHGGTRVIVFASSDGHIDVVKELLNDGRFNPSFDNNYAIQKASENGHLEIVKLLLSDKRVDPSDEKNTSIIWASENGHLEIVKELLKDKRVDPSDQDDLSISYAASGDHIDVVKELLKDERVDPSEALTYAIDNDQWEVVKLLKKHMKINESLKDKMKGKSDDELIKPLNKLSDSDKIRKIIEYKLPYDLLPNNLVIDGNLYCSSKKLTNLPDNLTINGDLICSYNELTSLPDNLTIKGSLDCSYNELISLPDNLVVDIHLYCQNNQLPRNIEKPKSVKGRFYK